MNRTTILIRLSTSFYFIVILSLNLIYFSAIMNNHIEIVKLLLQYRANINICNRQFQTPILLSCFETSSTKDLSEIIKILIFAKADLRIRDLKMKTIIHYLVEKRNIEILKYIIIVSSINFNKVLQ